MISMTLNGSMAEVLNDLETLLARRGAPANEQAAPVPVTVVPFETIPAGKRGKKAPAADTVIDQPAKAAEPESTEGLTVDEAREHMKKFAADGNMDQVSAALEHFGVKKVSDIDPDAKGAKSPKFSAFVSKIDELVKAKVAS